jgi:hypothetical protein
MKAILRDADMVDQAAFRGWLPARYPLTARTHDTDAASDPGPLEEPLGCPISQDDGSPTAVRRAKDKGVSEPRPDRLVLQRSQGCGAGPVRDLRVVDGTNPLPRPSATAEWGPTGPCVGESNVVIDGGPAGFGPVPVSTGGTGNINTPATGSEWTFDTTKLEQCCYVVRVHANDRAIVNSGNHQHHRSEDVGFCILD